MLESPPGLPQRYALQRLLGQGGQAKTFLARDEETDSDVAVKVFELRDAETWKSFDLFERECRVLRAIEHANVVRYIEHGGDEAAGVFFLVMEFAPGSSLEAAIAEGRRFTDAQLLGLTNMLLDTLEHLHSLNPPVIHRDIKPSNVVLAEDFTLKLVDFGGVREAFVDRSKSTVVGTFGYMAPEQLRGDATAASDIYGLGATLAAAATGTDASDLPTQGLEIDVEACIKPGAFRETLAGMLRADPRERLANAQAVRDRLVGPAQPVALASVDRKAAQRAALDTLVPMISDNVRLHLQRLARTGHRATAMKRFQELTGAGSDGAHQFIEQLLRRRARVAPELLSAGQRATAKRKGNALASLVAIGLVTASIMFGELAFIPFAFIAYYILRSVAAKHYLSKEAAPRALGRADSDSKTGFD